jgi:phosphate starvation-inducible membrane PsiE
MNKLSVIPKRFYSLVLALFLFVAMVILILLFVYSGIRKSHTMLQQLIIAKENTEKIYSLQQELILSFFYG